MSIHYKVAFTTNVEARTVSGHFVRVDGPGFSVVDSFEDKRYEWMLSRFAEYLQKEPEATGSIAKLADGKEYAMVLEAAQLALFRSDPAEAIRSLSPPARRVVVRERVSPSATSHLRIRAGVATLVVTFGELVWLRVREATSAEGSLIESPLTGRWVRKNTSQTLVDGVPIVSTIFRPQEGGWVGVRVDHLLTLAAERYYLSAAFGGWVSHADLKERYQTYLKEKANAEEQHPSP